MESGSVESFERGVIFRMGRGVGLVASIVGVFMVVGGGLVVTKTAHAYLASKQTPSVRLEDIRALVEPDAAASSNHAATADDDSDVVPGCPPKAVGALAATIAGDAIEGDDSAQPGSGTGEEDDLLGGSATSKHRPSNTSLTLPDAKQIAERQATFAPIIRSACEDVDDSYRDAFLTGAQKIVSAAPKGKKPDYFDAYRKVFDRKAALAAAERTSASSDTLASMILAATLTIGGLMVVALFGALLALLALERRARNGSPGLPDGPTGRAA